MRPDFRKYATGYLWLDKLTIPIWWVWEKWAEWRLFREIGGGDVKRGRRIFREAMAQVALEEVLAHMEEQ